jgi:hypothetical protein
MSGEPSGTRRRAATHFQYVFVDYVAEQVVIALVQPFGAPDEFTFRAVHAQKLAVGSVVIVGVGVPPRTAGTVAGTGIDTDPADTAGAENGIGGGMALVRHEQHSRTGDAGAGYPGLPGKIADA